MGPISTYGFTVAAPAADIPDPPSLREAWIVKLSVTAVKISYDFCNSAAVKSDAPVTVTEDKVIYLPASKPWDPLWIVTVDDPLVVEIVHPVIAVSSGLISKNCSP